MRIDVISIFPEYLEPLSLSLLGKAQSKSVLEINIHNLRDHTSDAHHTVDDTPYGGGAGMVMLPEPWGEAIDAVLASVTDGTRATLIFTTPAGALFHQRRAETLAATEWLIFACGRYEGIDARVAEHFATRPEIAEVLELSLGDYVLNGGEVAAMAIIEAVARLLPGVIGNPESLSEESHGTSGLLEAPAYTKPATWRGLEVPALLREGNHGKIAQWRSAQALERTRAVRPDLLPKEG
ncbi:MAG: tRNA (guanosine(37)-N1)-methyltransferase TrmD [Actinobacteria bacterium]|nr:MAG: tRNA (guanosine(37)-N1)-methyltransferase TrmD [Actinomycetota bacterium]